MKKICLIVVLFLAVIDVNAQLKWKENSSFEWRKSESKPFHKGNDMTNAHFTDRSSGTSYGFIGYRDNQVRSDYSRCRNYSAATRSYGYSPLSKKVWNENSRRGTRFFGGGTDAVDYGRRVRPKGAPGSYTATSAVGMKIGSQIKEMPVVGSNEGSGRKTMGQDNDGAAGEQYGFGEVPKDNAPLGDGIVLLFFMAFLFGAYKVLHQYIN